MTVASVNLANLRKVKNNVIGNPLAKLQLSRDAFFIRNLVDCLNYPRTPTAHDARISPNDIRIEAAHVIASLSYGSDEALLSLLHANAPRAFLYAIAHFQPEDPPRLRAAFTRALRALTVSIADVVGPSQYGLGPESSVAENDAKEALEFLFHVRLSSTSTSTSTTIYGTARLTPDSQIDSLDTLLPLLAQLAPTSIAELLAAAVRARPHRRAVAEWLPPADRAREVKTPTRRGWEKTSAVAAGPARYGGWVAKQLGVLIQSRDIKLQEAALGALAALAKDNPDVAGALAKTSFDRDNPPALQTVLALAKSRAPDVQLAACLCATHILRALARPSHVPHDETATRTVMDIVNRLLALGDAGPGPSVAQRTRACYVLCAYPVFRFRFRFLSRFLFLPFSLLPSCVYVYTPTDSDPRFPHTDHLVSDDTTLCQAAFDRGCLTRLVALVTSLPLPPLPLTQLELELDLGPTPALPASTSSLSSTSSSTHSYSYSYSYSYSSSAPKPKPKPTPTPDPTEDDEWDEPEGTAALREAGLTAIAAISLFDNDVRRALTEPVVPPSPSPPSPSPPHLPPAPGPGGVLSTSASASASGSAAWAGLGAGAGTGTGTGTPPPVMQVILAGLAHPAPGVRYAACQCVRAMSRAVAVLRTNIVDSGLGIGVPRVCLRRGEGGGGVGRVRVREGAVGEGAVREGEGEGEGPGAGEGKPGVGVEDKRVLGAALAAVCNMVNDFSPLRQVLLDEGLLARLVEIVGYEEPALRTSALWAMKNLLCRSTVALKRRVGEEVGWGKVLRLLEDPDAGVREQALNVLRNISEDEDGVELLASSMDYQALLDRIAAALKSPHEDIVLQASYLLANLSNGGRVHHERILVHPHILPALHTALTAATSLPLPVPVSPSPIAIAIASPTTPSSPPPSTSTSAATSRAESRAPIVACVAELARVGPARVRAAGLEPVLRHVCEWAAGGMGLGPGPGSGRLGGPGWEHDRGVVDSAKDALYWLGKDGGS
ncbi:hypothetical protein H0H81_007088 [Sphagnurus paluster]|uniref:Armadillo repeat-containing protein 8 n=1 Tax=Sphagnurus paluster TaxID=117069 RepID=A0A9P7K6E1_9AGAR|nr:hypothetical protein H0H81_007088 [Sphagnurus paluster]